MFYATLNIDYSIVSQLISDATPMRDSDTETYQEDGDQPPSSLQCDAEIEVTPDRKNA